MRLTKREAQEALTAFAAHNRIIAQIRSGTWPNEDLEYHEAKRYELQDMLLSQFPAKIEASQ